VIVYQLKLVEATLLWRGFNSELPSIQSPYIQFHRVSCQVTTSAAVVKDAAHDSQSMGSTIHSHSPSTTAASRRSSSVMAKSLSLRSSITLADATA